MARSFEPGTVSIAVALSELPDGAWCYKLGGQVQQIVRDEIIIYSRRHPGIIPNKPGYRYLVSEDGHICLLPDRTPVLLRMTKEEAHKWIDAHC